MRHHKMSLKTLVGTLVTAGFMGVAGAAIPGVAASAVAEALPKATLYRNPNCDCCLDYAKYLQDNGVEVTVDSKQDLAGVRMELRVPEKFQGCHVMTVGRYAVEGHVPINAIRKLMAERPSITGIAIPGMPPGTPGMGAKTGPLTVVEISQDSASPKVFSVE